MSKRKTKEFDYGTQEVLEQLTVNSWQELKGLIDTIYDDLTKLRDVKTDVNERLVLLLLRRSLGKVMKAKLDLLEERGPHETHN